MIKNVARGMLVGLAISISLVSVLLFVNVFRKSSTQSATPTHDMSPIREKPAIEPEYGSPIAEDVASEPDRLMKEIFPLPMNDDFALPPQSDTKPSTTSKLPTNVLLPDWAHKLCDSLKFHRLQLQKNVLHPDGGTMKMEWGTVDGISERCGLTRYEIAKGEIVQFGWMQFHVPTGTALPAKATSPDRIREVLEILNPDYSEIIQSFCNRLSEIKKGPDLLDGLTPEKIQWLANVTDWNRNPGLGNAVAPVCVCIGLQLNGKHATLMWGPKSEWSKFDNPGNSIYWFTMGILTLDLGQGPTDIKPAVRGIDGQIISMNWPRLSEAETRKFLGIFRKTSIQPALESQPTRRRAQRPTREAVPCSKCYGTGLLLCTQCNGNGFTVEGPDREYIACWKCDGTKKIKCQICHGRGRR